MAGILIILMIILVGILSQPIRKCYYDLIAGLPSDIQPEYNPSLKKLAAKVARVLDSTIEEIFIMEDSDLE